MIKNERQYNITRAQLKRFESLAEELRSHGPLEAADSRRRLELAAANAQVTELRQQLAEYEGLREGRVSVGPLRSLDELPELLTRARVAAGLTQRELAERLGVKEQQVQRYEATRWAGASLSRLIDVARLLEIDIDAEALDRPSTSLREMSRNARRAGLDSTFIRQRLLPPGADRATTPVLNFAVRLNRVFGWSPSSVLSGDIDEPELPSQLAASYKLPSRASDSRVRAYTVYTHYLALLALDACSAIPRRNIPRSASECRSEILGYGGMTFRSALQFAWDLGIPVLPLSEPGGFHAIVWRAGSRNVITLKQQQRTASRWLFDLLHELQHAAAEPDESERVFIDDESTGADEKEATANQFAGDVTLDGRAESLVQECVAAARGSVERLKAVTPAVARRGGVNTGDLANYVAYRLSLQGINWWGAASNLQPQEPDPWLTARDEFFARADFGRLAPIDAELLAQALSE